MKNLKSYSMVVRIASALFVLVIIQGLLLVASISVTGVINQNNIAAYNILSNQSNNRKNEIQNALNTRRKNITNVSLELSKKIEEMLSDQNAQLDVLDSDSDIAGEILDLSLLELIEFTKYNAVTGAFVIFDPTQDIADETKTDRSCMYIRDSSPGIFFGNNSNLSLEYGEVDIARSNDIAVDYLWTVKMDFSQGFYRDFYFKPVRAVLEDPTYYDKPQTYGYWSTPFRLRKDDLSVVTYSLPLILSDGTVYGVMGFELDVSYISSLMSAAEVAYDKGFYLLGADKGGGFQRDNIISSGIYANQFLVGSQIKLNFDLIHENEKGSVFVISNEYLPDYKMIGAYNEVGFYETFSPFYDEKWVLICIAPEASVISGSNSIKGSITASILLTTILALVLSIFINLYIFKPIYRLSHRVKSIDPEKPVRLGRTGIQEIDELSGAFEVLSDDVSEAAAKMFRIIELVNMPLGSFEVNYKKGEVRASKSLFRLLNLEAPSGGMSSISMKEWTDFMGTLTEDSFVLTDEGIVETLCASNSLRDTKRWFRMRLSTENSRDIGVLIDVTDEIMQKQRLEFERNHDPLTKLLNRQAFLARAFEQMKSNPDKAGVMMFADLDDLKFINDLHGHETGDNYIRTFADFLNRFQELGAAVGRVSGDEFVMFMTGFDSPGKARDAFDSVFLGVRDLRITAPDGSPHKLRVSVGLSYYPDDSDDIKELVKYSDYAMYEIKHTIKGEVQEFNIGSYNKNSFVISMKNIFNLFIEEKKVRFAFQPIVDVRTGEIYAYEALMRSLIPELKSPDDILRIARSQSKLYQIEKLTITLVLDWLSVNTEKIGNKKIFINSIPNQILSKSDLDKVFEKYGFLLDKVVFEVMETEFSSYEDTKKKMGAFKSFGSMIAIDDYGSGYSNPGTLLAISPEFLKIDMSIIRDIDKDIDKQQLTENIIAYAAKKDIKIIAEGVETLEEMETVIRFGVDYIQGYYLAKPNFEIIDISEDLKDELIEISRNNEYPL